MEGAAGSSDPGNVKFSSEDTCPLQRPSLTYIALIAKVILSSPSKKLNLASIYSAMGERFPYLRDRGPGWKNSVRHNLSVNDCFVKVDRCEDGRGHYWGVHQAHLKDFQRGNFRHYRRGRDRKERRTGNTGGDMAWMKSRCFSESRSGPCVGTHCPLQEPQGHQLSPPWTWPCCQPQWVSVCWPPSPGWMNQAQNPPASHRSTAAESQHARQPLTSGPHRWDVNDVMLTTGRESYDSWVVTPQLRAGLPVFPGLPVCWCVPPAMKSENVFFLPDF